MRGAVLARFNADFPGGAFVLKGKAEAGTPCSCLLNARSMTINDNCACNPSPATLATTSLEETFALREADDVAVDAGAYDLRAVIMWFGVTTGVGPSRPT